MFAFRLAASYAQVTQDTIAYYSFDDTKGKTVTSATGKFDGMLEGNASVVPSDLQKNALKIGDCEDYMVVESFGFADLPNGTIELWVKLLKASTCGRTDAGEWTVIANLGGDFGSNADASSLGTGEWAVGSKNMLFGIYDGDWHWANSGISIEELYGDWHHLAGTWGKKGLEIWVDGEKKGALKDYTAPIPTNLGEFLLIGANAWRQTINGLIDAVRISRKQLAENDFLFPLPVQPKGNLTTIWGELKSDI